MTHLIRNSAPAPGAGRAIVPTMPYRNASAMVDWLSDAYGLEKRRVVTSASGRFQHAQLAHGGGSILVVGIEDSRLERLVVHPDQIGGVETQACYLVVPDVDAHFARATAKGAEIVSGIEGKEPGDRYYVTRDPEGHIWMFGTYDPSTGRHLLRIDDGYGRGGGRRKPLAILTLVVLAVLITSIAAGMWTYGERLAGLRPDVVSQTSEERDIPLDAQGDAAHVADQLLQVRTARESAERKLSQAHSALEAAQRAEKEARDSLAQAMRAREEQAQKAKNAENQLGQERAAREAAERMARDAADQLGRAQLARGTAERVAKEMAERLETERRSRALAEQSVQSSLTELARERGAKAAAELAANELRAQLMAPGGNTSSQGILALRDQLEAERRTRETLERAAKDAQLQLAQERFSHDSTERALKQVQDRLEKTQDRLASASCWACPSGAPCSQPN
jgi:uncharacterized glyoxalase superfamily protein PhnB